MGNRVIVRGILFSFIIIVSGCITSSSSSNVCIL